MYSWINLSVESFVIEKYGIDAWEAIKKEAGCLVPNGGFALKLEYLDDSETVSLVVAGAKLLGVDASVVLEAFGKYFVHFVIKNGYGGLLKAQGTDLRSFISNLNSLHAHLAANAFPEMLPPGFEVTNGAEQPRPLAPDEFVIKYSSRRDGLYPLAIGVLTEASRMLFEKDITCTLIRTEKVATMDQRAGALKPQNDTFLLIKMLDDSAPGVELREARKASASIRGSLSCPALDGHSIAEPGSVPRKDAVELFPFHLSFDKDLRIVSMGCKVQDIANRVRSSKESLKGKLISDVFEITSPSDTKWDAESLRTQAKDTAYTVRLNSWAEAMTPLELTGQIYFMSSEIYVFICSPSCSSVDDLVALGLQLFDIPAHDKTRELILMNERLRAEVDRNERLEKETKSMSTKRRSKIATDASAELLRYLNVQSAVEVFWLIVGIVDIVLLAVSGLQAALAQDAAFGVQRAVVIAFAFFAALCVLVKISMTVLRARSLRTKMIESRTGRIELHLPTAGLELGTGEGGQASMSKAYGKIKQLDYDIEASNRRLIGQLPNLPLLCIQGFIAFTGLGAADVTPQLKISLILGAVTIGAHLQLFTRVVQLQTERASLLVKIQKEEVDKVEIRATNEKAVMEMLGKVVNGFARTKSISAQGGAAPIVASRRRDTLEVPNVRV